MGSFRNLFHAKPAHRGDENDTRQQVRAMARANEPSVIRKFNEVRSDCWSANL